MSYGLVLPGRVMLYMRRVAYCEVRIMSLRSSYDEYDYKKVEKKSEEFLKTIMGDEKFCKLQKNGKVEIEVDNKTRNGTDQAGKTVYELYSDGRLINKTKNQSYCIVTDRSDYPVNDLVAIKFAWLVHRNDITEKVANKTNLDAGNRPIAPGYEEYVHYLSSNGWQREQLTIDQYNTHVITTWNLNVGSTGQVVDARCPTGMKMSIMGMRQVPRGADARIAYSLGLYVADDDGEEISDHTKIRITKMRSSEFVIQLARVYYQDIKMTQDGEATYRFHQGIELNGEDYLMLYIIESPKNIRSENVKFKMNADLWIRN